MKDKEIVKLLKKRIEEKEDDFKLVMGRKVYSKNELLRLLDKDKKFREQMISLVYELSIDVLMRGK